MNSEKKEKILFVVGLIAVTVTLATVILAIDFLYAGVQEHFLKNINPNYVPNLPLANRVIIGSSIAIVVGLIFYAGEIWLLIRPKNIRQKLEEEQVIAGEELVNFKSFQEEIQDSVEVLKDLFGYLIAVVIITGLFTFLRFIWMATRYSLYSEFIIQQMIGNVPSLLMSISIYVVLALMVSFLVITSFKKYFRLQIISSIYSKAMEKVQINLELLLEEDRKKQVAGKEETGAGGEAN